MHVKEQNLANMVTFTMRKMGVLQLALQFTIYTVQLIAFQLQLYRHNSFSITMQLPYDYNHNVMLTLFFIHPSKFNTWHYEDFF
jgi:hypothetical protein